MNTNCTYRIVNLQHFINEFNTKYNNETSQDTNDRCGSRRYSIAACSDGNKTSQGSVQGHGYIWFFVTYPCDQHNCNSSNCGSKVSSDKYLAGSDNSISFHGNCGSTIKSKPAEPEDKYSKSAYCQVMTRNCF